MERRASASCWALLRAEPDERPSPALKAFCSGGRGERWKGRREGEGVKKAPPWLCWRSVQKGEMGVG